MSVDYLLCGTDGISGAPVKEKPEYTKIALLAQGVLALALTLVIFRPDGGIPQFVDMWSLTIVAALAFIVSSLLVWLRLTTGFARILCFWGLPIAGVVSFIRDAALFASRDGWGVGYRIALPSPLYAVILSMFLLMVHVLKRRRYAHSHNVSAA